MLSWQVEKSSPKISPDFSHRKFQIEFQIKFHQKIHKHTSAGLAALSFNLVLHAREGPTLEPVTGPVLNLRMANESHTTNPLNHQHPDINSCVYISGTKKEPKPKLLSPDIFRWGRGLPHERVGGQRFRYAPRNQGNQTFLAGYPGIWPGYPGVPEKFEKKKFGFNFSFPNIHYISMYIHNVFPSLIAVVSLLLLGSSDSSHCGPTASSDLLQAFCHSCCCMCRSQVRVGSESNISLARHESKSPLTERGREGERKPQPVTVTVNSYSHRA